MKLQVVSALVGVLAAGASPVLADSTATASGTVVELYTSQGCSSCPPADAYLAKLAAEPGVIALALHVDYWDYIGWTDKFSNPQYTQRQRAYAHAASSNTIYTPQMIVGGVDLVEGNDPAVVEAAIRRHQTTSPMVALQLMHKGDKVTIAAQANAKLDAPLQVQLVRYHPTQRVEITRGENAGRTLDYANVVTSWSVVGQWDGKSDLYMTAPAAGQDVVVVILQSEGPGQIMAAAQVK